MEIMNQYLVPGCISIDLSLSLSIYHFPFNLSICLFISIYLSIFHSNNHCTSLWSEKLFILRNKYFLNITFFFVKALNSVMNICKIHLTLCSEMFKSNFNCEATDLLIQYLLFHIAIYLLSTLVCIYIYIYIYDRETDSISLYINV